MSSLTATRRVVPGSAVATVLAQVHRRLSSPRHWSADAWATFADGRPISDLTDLPRAERVSVTGAIDASTADLGVQEAACRALRQAADAAGLRCSLRRIDRDAGHGVLMTTLQSAMALARSQTWPVREAVVLPERPPTLEEYRELTRVRGLIAQRFFAGERHGGEQFDATRALALDRFDQQRAIDAYLQRHRTAIEALLSAHGQQRPGRRRALGHTARSLARRVAPARRRAGSADDPS